MCAKWIWIDRDTLSAVDTFVVFRKQFKCEASRPVLRLAAVTNFELRVNGTVIPGSQFSDLMGCPSYTDFDLRKIWLQGRNLIEVTVLSVGRACFTSAIQQPGLWAQLRDGKNVLVETDSSWDAAFSPGYRSGLGIPTTPQLGDAFCYDARKSRADWQHAVEFEGEKPMPRPFPPLGEQPAIPAKVVQAGALLRRNDDPDVTVAQLVSSDFLRPEVLDARYVTKGTEELQRNYWGSPKAFWLRQETAGRVPFQFQSQDANGWYLIVDLGGEATGWLTFTIQATEGAVLDIAHGEHLDDGRVRAFVGGRNFADRYICHDGLNTFTHRLRRLGCRYLEMHITEASRPPQVGYLGIIPVYRALPTPKNFRTEDSALIQLDRVGIHTMRCCQHEHFEDCPWREQSLYAYDSRNQALYGYYVWGNYDFAYTSFALLAGNPDLKRQLLEIISPGTCHLNIPIFSLVWISAVWELYLHSGLPQCKDFLNVVDLLLDAILARGEKTPEGLLYIPDDHEGAWNFCEWVPGLDGNTAHFQAAYNLYLIESLRNAAKLHDAFYVSQPADYNALADDLAIAVEKAFWDEQRGCYRTDEKCELTHEHIQVLALYNQIVPKGKVAKVLDAMNAPTTICSSFGALPYWVRVMNRLSRETRSEIMPRLRSSFLPSVFQGATTLWETADGGNDFAYAGSLCHGWSSLPCYYFRAGILGVTPVEPGFTKFRVNPNAADLTHAEGEVPTPYGPIHVAWMLDRNGRPNVIELDAPKECRLVK